MIFWESKLIHKLRGKTFVPFLHFVGDEKTEDGKMYHVMVMDLLGKSLEDLFQECRRKFDLKTVLHISVQMVSAIILQPLGAWHLSLYVQGSFKTINLPTVCVFDFNDWARLWVVIVGVFVFAADPSNLKSARGEDHPSRYQAGQLPDRR